MIKHKKRKIKYEALGFVESMIAIMIVGISSVVLMQIAVNTMKGIMQNEAIDNMTQHAVEAGEIVQELANRNKLTEEVLFPEPTDYGGLENCFMFDMVEGEIRFKKDEKGESFVRFENSFEEREKYKELGTLGDDELFRFICLQQPVGTTVDDLTFVIANIVVGQRVSGGVITKGNLVKDYEYSTVIKLLGGNIATNVTPPDAVPNDGVCSPGENAGNSPKDCKGYCGDEICNEFWGETVGNCIDCVECGDGICSRIEVGGMEDENNCPADCINDGYCYDFVCTNLDPGIIRPCEKNDDCLYYCINDNYCNNDENKYCIEDEDCAPE